MSGTANFFGGYLKNQDFAVTSMSFVGFFLMGVGYKLLLVY